MNLNQVVSGTIAAVNPNQYVQIRASTGYAISPDGTQAPSYAAPVTLLAQVQELSSRDLRQLEGLNIGGSQKVIYLNGTLSSVIRLNQKGGDLVVLPNGTTWLTTSVLEDFDAPGVGWVKCAITQQVN